MDFYSRIDQGSLPILTDKRLLDYVASFKHETYVTVSIKKTVSKRSVQQNRLWHLYVQILASELGYEHDEMHEICKFKFLRKVRVDENTGNELEYIGSTAKLNKTEFSELVEKLIRWAAMEFNIVLPLPDSQLNINI
jgi:hypothetical protein